jgi:hypothetical protein
MTLLEDRFWGSVNLNGSYRGPWLDVCWEWEGAKTSGYGSVGVKKDTGEWKTTQAHRVVYKMWVGPLIAGETIDHLCRNKSCVNPDHLEQVSNAENRRCAGLAVSFCPQGHIYAGANLRLRPNGYRECVACNKVRCDAYYVSTRKDR